MDFVHIWTVKNISVKKQEKKLGYIKGWWGTTHEHHGFEDCDDEGLKDGRNKDLRDS